MTSDGGSDLYVPAGGDWQLWDTIPTEDMLTTGDVLRQTNHRLYMKDSRGRNTSALVESISTRKPSAC